MLFGSKYKKDLELFDKAGEALRSDRFRKGDVIVLPGEGDLIISGDIHGNLDNLRRLQELANLAANPKRHLVLHELIHNIYNDDFQGDYSYECLTEVAAYKLQYPDQVHYILGNHELCEIQQRAIMKDGKPIPLVFRNLSDFGRVGPELFEKFKAFAKSIPIAVSAPSAGVWFSHSTPEKQLRNFSLEMFLQAAVAAPGMLQKASGSFRDDVIEDLVWGRDYSLESARAFCEKVKAQVLIVGHTPCAEEGYIVPNPYHVIIDSKDSNAVFVYLRLDKKYTQKGIVANIRKLYG